MANSRKDLKAYVRFDGSGRVVPGSLILRRKMPKVGKWKEITAYECCNPVPSPSFPTIICSSVYDDKEGTYFSFTFNYTSDDSNGYPIYLYTPFEGPVTYIFYNSTEGAWQYAIGNILNPPFISSLPTTNKNILDVSWSGDPVVAIITSGVCPS